MNELLHRWQHALVLISLLLLQPATLTAATTSTPQRIISLAPHITELLYTIDAGDRLVATVEFSDYPQQALKLPRIGNVYQLDWERLLGLQPDLVIAWQDGTPANVIARLRALNIPLQLVRAHSLEAIAAQINHLGRMTGNATRAVSVANDYLQQLRALQQRYTGQSSVSVFFEIDHAPLYTINDRQIISDAIRICGGRNIFADLPALAAQISTEAVLQRRPELIIYAGSSMSPDQAFADWRRWQTLPAVKKGQLVAINPDLISRATPRMLQGVTQLCEAIQAARQE